MKSVQSTWSIMMAAFVMLLSIVISSCAEDGIVEDSPQIFMLPQSQEIVAATLTGTILDEAGAPLSNAQVSYLSGLDETTIATDDYGFFKMEGIQNKGNAAFLSVTYPGKFEAFRKFSVVPNQYNYTEIKMLDRTIIGSISADAGGTLVSDDNASITLPKGGIVDSREMAYMGDVSVAMSWIDPSGEDLAQRMIGDLSGLDSEGGYRSLSSMGMLQVELSDANGNELNIAPGDRAELKFPIPAELLSKATSTIPLWSYNEDIGTWIQEGIAKKEGDFYVGIVSHFSAWNVDFMTDPIEIKGKVLLSTESGEVSGGSYLQVYVCSEEIGRKGGWLCDDGSFRFYNFPKGEQFKIKVYNDCGGQLFQETYGPFENDEDLGDIVVTNIKNQIKIIGNAVDCNLMPLANAELTVYQGSVRKKFPIDDQGRFEFVTDLCSDTKATLEVLNRDDLLFNSVEVPLDKPLVEVADLKVCEAFESFVEVTPEGLEGILYTNIIHVAIEEDQGEQLKFVSLSYGNEEFDNVDTLDQKLIEISFAVDVNTEEANMLGFLFINDGLFCTGLGPIDVTNTEATISLTKFECESGGFIQGSFRVEEVICLNWITGETTTTVVEGNFSVPVR